MKTVWFMYCVSCVIAFGDAALNGTESVLPDGSLIVHAEDESQAVVFTPEQARIPYLPDFVRWAQIDIGTIPRRDALLAIGSSSIVRWTSIAEDLSPTEVIHRGFGGSTMQQAVCMLDFFLRYEARKILIYQGDNDLADPKTDIEQDFLSYCRVFVSAALDRHPGTQIFLISIKPSPARRDALERYANANRRLAEFCDSDPRLHYIDVFHVMLDERGLPRPELFVDDMLHLNVRGYALWTQIIGPVINPSQSSTN